MKIIFFILIVSIVIGVPINITSCDDLFTLIVNDPSAEYDIINDIDCSSNMNLSPIGSNSFLFNGTINGNGKTIGIKKIKNIFNNYFG